MKRLGLLAAMLALFGMSAMAAPQGRGHGRGNDGDGQLPPGLQKHVDRTGQLPPGLQKKVDNGGQLPPGLQKRFDNAPTYRRHDNEWRDRQVRRRAAARRRAINRAQERRERLAGSHR